MASSRNKGNNASKDSKVSGTAIDQNDNEQTLDIASSLHRRATQNHNQQNEDDSDSENKDEKAHLDVSSSSSPADLANTEIPERVQPGMKVFSKKSWFVLIFYRILKNPNKNLDRLAQFLGSSNGQDKAWMFVQYFTKVLAWLFAMRQRTKF